MSSYRFFNYNWMIKILLKTALLIFILLIIGVVFFRGGFLPFYWGNIQLNTKIQLLKKENIDPRAYFIGSSVTYRHTIPSLINKKINKPEYYSFNLGIDGAFPPQTFYILEHLIEIDSTIDYIFFEVNSFDDLAPHIFRTTRSKYYSSSSYLYQFGKYLFSSDLRLTHKLGMLGKYLVTYLENIFKIGMRTDYLKFINGRNIYGPKIIGEKKDGFLPLPSSKTKDQIKKKRLDSYLLSIKRKYQNIYHNNSGLGQEYYNKYLRELLIKQMEWLKTKNIKLIYILNPVEFAFDKTPSMVSLFYSLPEENRIDLANPIAHPEFYMFENRWDEGHLNHRGATIYSDKLANLFNNLPK